MPDQLEQPAKLIELPRVEDEEPVAAEVAVMAVAVAVALQAQEAVVRVVVQAASSQVLRNLMHLPRKLSVSP